MLDPRQSSETENSTGTQSGVPWKVSGYYFEACSCESVCPCYSGKPPTYDVCEGNGVWHVKTGIYGETALDGLNVAYAIRCEGLMRANLWNCWFYIDDRATPEQYDALTKIFTARAGGTIGKIFHPLWKIENVERSSIEVELQGWQHKASIKDKFLLTIGRLLPEFGPVLCRVPNVPGMSARSGESWFKGDKLEFNLKDKNALSTTFEYHSDQ
jgi:hypothetical protein